MNFQKILKGVEDKKTNNIILILVQVLLKNLNCPLWPGGVIGSHFFKEVVDAAK